MDNFQEKKQARIDRYKVLGDKSDIASTERYEQAHAIGRNIPFGQPILVGHHSEGRHRRDLQKIDNNMRKSCELRDKAEYYRNRAEAAESNTSIFSDDPEAIKKIKNKLQILEKQHLEMIDINKQYRKHKGDISKITANEKIIKALKFYKEHANGYSPCNVAGSNAEIRRLKQRLTGLEKNANSTTTTTEKNGVKIVENVEENRCQVFFDGIPDVSIRKQLKGYSFRWSPNNGCWQRHRSRIATSFAHEILEMTSTGSN